MQKKIRKILAENPVIPVFTPQSVSETLTACERLLEQNINCIEITLRTECALEAVEAVKNSGLDIILGVGTISNADTIKTLQTMGVDFGVSPGLTNSLLQVAVELDFPLLPGIATPSELLTGLEYGFDTFKLFPANALNVKVLLKAFYSTYPQVRFCPTGGINAETKDDLLQLPNVMSVGGSWLFK